MARDPGKEKCGLCQEKTAKHGELNVNGWRSFGVFVGKIQIYMWFCPGCVKRMTEQARALVKKEFGNP